MANNLSDLINLKKYDIPAMKVNFPEDIFEDKHLKEINFFKTTNHPTEGELLYPSIPTSYNDDIQNEALHAPNLGEHTKELLLSIGYSNSEIESLVSRDVIKIWIFKGNCMEIKNIGFIYLI